MPYYAVAIGRKKGIVKTWDECQALVDRFSGAKYRKFAERRDAAEFLNKHRLPVAAKRITPPCNKALHAKKRKSDKKWAKRQAGHHAKLVADVKTTHGEHYFEIDCDCLPWNGCMKCVPIVESRWPAPAQDYVAPRHAEIGYF